MRNFRIWPLLAALTLAGIPAAGVNLVTALTATTASDEFCNPGPQSSSFSVTDPVVWIYTSIQEAEKNDIYTFEWLSPDGSVFSITNIPPLDVPGDWCFNIELPIAGTNAENFPGLWTVRGIYNGSMLFSVDFNIIDPNAVMKPMIWEDGVVNGASGQLGFSAGQWVTIRGQRLTNLVRTLDFENGSYPTSSDGVSVTFNGEPGFLYYLSPEQINVVSPDLTVSGPVEVVVTNNGVSSETMIVQIQPAAPAAFLWPGSYAVATDANFELKVKPGVFEGLTTTSASPDEVIILWVAGLGETNPAAVAGRPVPGDELHSVTGNIRVLIGGVQAEVIGAALAPGIAALYQVAIRVPNLSDGDHEVKVEVDGISSPAGAALLTVQN